MHDVDTCAPCAQGHAAAFLTRGQSAESAPDVVAEVARLMWCAADLNARRQRLLRESAALSADVELLASEASAMLARVDAVGGPVAERARRLLAALSDPSASSRLASEVARVIGVLS